MSLSVQFLSLLAMIGTGIGAGVLMDLIGTGVDATGKKSIIRKYAVPLEVVGWIVIGCASFYVLFVVRDGAWRMYDPVAQICGMLLYASIFHRPFRFLGRILNMLIIKPIWFIVRLVAKIISRTFQLLIKIVRFLLSPFIFLYYKVSDSLFKSAEK
ncbi:spore cortex biosynthesis protein YabQ [Sporosarcina sp. Marseille-Q4943]|uniref:spore cortex biosynthesis protein YabQ n=1 Tax=Sporosarcina sp. Marseille-Q4943 TaxID=2942204 RepID=UPI003531944B